MTKRGKKRKQLTDGLLGFRFRSPIFFLLFAVYSTEVWYFSWGEAFLKIDLLGKDLTQGISGERGSPWWAHARAHLMSSGCESSLLRFEWYILGIQLNESSCLPQIGLLTEFNWNVPTSSPTYSYGSSSTGSVTPELPTPNFFYIILTCRQEDRVKKRKQQQKHLISFWADDLQASKACHHKSTP